jgi:hypothetical protein
VFQELDVFSVYVKGLVAGAGLVMFSNVKE